MHNLLSTLLYALFKVYNHNLSQIKSYIVLWTKTLERFHNFWNTNRYFASRYLLRLFSVYPHSMFNFGKLKMRVYFTWCGETVISGGKFKCWRIRECWQKLGDWNEMSQVASPPACASSQELGKSVPSRYLHFSIQSSAIPNIQGVYSVFICKSAIYCWRPVWPGEVAEGGAGLLTIYQTCPLVFILQY